MANRSERMRQRSLTAPIKPEVSIVSSTKNPIGTIFSMWTGVRNAEAFDPVDVQFLYDHGDQALTISSRYEKIANTICKWYPEYAGEDGRDYKSVIFCLVQKVIALNVPVSESVSFNIKVENGNVAWREQLVRGRNSQWFWVTSSRTTDLSTMDVTMSDSVRLLGGEEAVQIYAETVDVLREAYRRLTDLGVPMEDIRLQPQSHTERDYWMITLRTLIPILNKRSDWIAQSSLWAPVVAGVLKELRRIGIYDIIAPFIGKPLAEVSQNPETGEYLITSHSMDIENDDRYSGRDKIPCDPLWLAYKGYSMPEHTDLKFYDYMKSMYIQIWQDEYLKVLGWDRDNPEHLGPYDRPV